MTRSFVMINYSFVDVLRLPPLRSTSTAPFVGPKDIRGVWPLSHCAKHPRRIRRFIFGSQQGRRAGSVVRTSRLYTRYTAVLYVTLRSYEGSTRVATNFKPVIETCTVVDHSFRAYLTSNR